MHVSFSNGTLGQFSGVYWDSFLDQDTLLNCHITQCLECGKMYHDVGGIQQHVRAIHGLDTKMYKAKYGISKMMTREVKYTCVVCEQSGQYGIFTIGEAAWSTSGV